MQSYTTHSAIEFGESEKATFLAEFRQGGHGRHWPDGIRYFDYDTATYPFAEHIRRMLVDKGLLDATQAAALDKLENLHRVLRPELMNLDASEINEVTRSFYEQDKEFLDTYERFYRDVIRGRVTEGQDFLFQTTPTIRFHFPNQKGFNWSPRFHTDVMLGHPPQEVNLWLPVTRTFDTNTMRLAGLADSLGIFEGVGLDFKEFARLVQEEHSMQKKCQEVSKPVCLDYGQFVAFDSRCLHATQENKTHSTRISLDFRVLPLKDYHSLSVVYRGTGRRQMLFQQGHYYDARTSESL
jgi:hypothetical protein